jgi:hypothetical protein
MQVTRFAVSLALAITGIKTPIMTATMAITTISSTNEKPACLLLGFADIEPSWSQAILVVLCDADEDMTQRTLSLSQT